MLPGVASVDDVRAWGSSLERSDPVHVRRRKKLSRADDLAHPDGPG